MSHYRSLLLCLLACLPLFIYPQSVSDYTVRVHATVQANPPGIMLQWPQDPSATGYTLYRKSQSATLWGVAYASLAGADTQFVDTAVAVGDAWEYRLLKSASGYSGNGYIFAGLGAPELDYRGKVLLVIDTTYAAALATELDRLEEDLWGDGWIPVRIPVDRSDAVASVKTQIVNAWNADPANVRAVFLFGHVPVPYSGSIAPDGHSNHSGAWPADVYYGEMNGNWTDASVNNTTAARTANHNVPGDGKFDNSVIPNDVELMVGRVDFANMGTFTEGEEALLRRYLDKDHAWRHKEFTSAPAAVIDDNFGVFGGETFAANGWRNFAPLVGPENVSAGDYRTNLNAADHLWSYGCGGGSYTSASGVGNSGNFASDSLRGVFTMLFGSYHGDWDSNNNFMRASLASRGTILSCAWAGRPHWQFHHMGLGEPIGYSARLTQNNSGNLYFSSFFARYIHIALMGDPTVRMHVVAPPSGLVVTPVNGGRDHQLTWSPSPDSVAGYHVYLQDTATGRYWRANAATVTDTAYVDSCLSAGTYRYMVRAVALENGRSGSYYNLSQGIFGETVNAIQYTLTTGNPADSVICPGDTLLIPYTAPTDFCPGNTFAAELSDALGGFSSPVAIGAVVAVSSGTITAVVPPGSQPGPGYRVRVTASQPAYTAPDNGTDLSIPGAAQAAFTFQLNGNTLTLTNSGSGATAWAWDFGDGNTSTQFAPSHVYAGPGSYTVQLIASNKCSADTFTMPVTVVGVGEARAIDVAVFPNPAHGRLRLRASLPAVHDGEVLVTDALGRVVRRLAWTGDLDTEIDTESWARGMYLVMFRTSDLSRTVRVAVE